MQTERLQLPFISSTQASPLISHNEALRRLDAIVQPVVETDGLSSPPSDAADGSCYIVGPDAVAQWQGAEGEIAAFLDGAWEFFTPGEGWQVYIRTEGVVRTFDGEAWILPPLAADRLGINAAADAVNRLSVAASSTLLSHDGDSHRAVINKASTPDTASLIFQQAFSGRAEFGLLGDQSFRVKVSPDGNNWTDALSVNPTSGAVALPQGLSSPLPVSSGGTGATNALSALNTIGLRYNVGNIADDAVATVNFGSNIFGSVIFLVGNTTGVPLGTVFARMASGPQLAPLGVAGGTLGTFTTDLTGTTGPDGQVNMTALEGGVFKIENRRGHAISYTLYLLR